MKENECVGDARSKEWSVGGRRVEEI